MVDKIEGVTITTHPRLHFTLLAMHSGEYRVNGGLGFSVESPISTVKGRSSATTCIRDMRLHAGATSELDWLRSIVEAERTRQQFDIGIELFIHGEMQPHTGFGSGTAISLACLEALHVVNGSAPTSEALIYASGRGGTSGIGINTYFNGGCVFDLGRPIDDAKFVPSSAANTRDLPLVLDRIAMPDWEIGICIPMSIQTKTQSEEQQFFAKVCPLSPQDAYESTYHALFGLYASIKEVNWENFCRAVRAVQRCAWKNAERREYGVQLEKVENDLYSCGATAVGMSSLGPALFFLASDVPSVVQQMRGLKANCRCFLTRTSNSGRKIENA